MKQAPFIKTILAATTLLLFFQTRSFAQAQEAQQLLLNIEKLSQLKQILSDMKKGYQVVSAGYGRIKDLSEGNFKLHQLFLDGLLNISPTVRNYRRIPEIIQLQLSIMSAYKDATRAFNANALLRDNERSYISQVHLAVVNQSITNLGTLTDLVTAGTLRMSDDERLCAIDAVYMDMQDKYAFITQFNNRCRTLVAQRQHENNNGQLMRKLYGQP